MYCATMLLICKNEKILRDIDVKKTLQIYQITYKNHLLILHNVAHIKSMIGNV